MPGCTCHNNAGSGRFKVIQAFTPVIIRTSIRHQEYKGTPVTFSVSRRFLYFFGNGAGREESASPRDVVPLAVSAGIWKLRRSVRGLPVGLKNQR